MNILVRRFVFDDILAHIGENSFISISILEELLFDILKFYDFLDDER